MTVVLTYQLKGQMKSSCLNTRPFCPNCTNTFKSVTCNSPCSNGPTIICLTPTIPGPVGYRFNCAPTSGIPDLRNAPPVLVLQLSSGINLSTTDHLCEPILDPIGLFYQPDWTQLSYPNQFAIPGDSDPTGTIVYESSWINWPGPGTLAAGCFSGLVKFQYYIMQLPYFIDALKNANAVQGFGCGIKVFRILFDGGGQSTFVLDSGTFPCGGIAWGNSYTGNAYPGIELIPMQPTNDPASVAIPMPMATADTGTDRCAIFGGTPTDPAYGMLLGVTGIHPLVNNTPNPRPISGVIPFTIKFPS